MQIKPLNKRIVVRRIQPSNVTESGIELLSADSDQPLTGEIVTAFEGSQVQPGERILFGKYAGVSVTIDEQELLVMTENDILVVFN